MGSQKKDPSLHKVVLEDLRQTKWGRDYVRELDTLYHFYLDDDRRTELASMGRIRRAFSVLFWILKSLLMKLSPARRVMLLVALIFGVAGWQNLASDSLTLNVDLRPWGFVLLLIILMLELRDKLLARDEIAVARQVQLALFPDRHPEVPGWCVWSVSRPANDVGGDLVDYIELDGFRHGIVLGDVAGKGLGAALLTAKLQATLRAIVPSVASLDDLGGRVNDIFHRDGLDNRYATLFFVELQHDSGHLRYLNAGHNPPFVIRSDGLEKLHASSYPLGILASATYEEGVLDLETGDVIVAYTDGLTEACNDKGEEFGMQRLEDVLVGLRNLPSAEIGSSILRHVDRFLGDSRPTDDLSLAVMVKL